MRGSEVFLKLCRTESFQRDFQKLPQEVRFRAERVLLLLAENPRHPSLRAKKMHGTEDRWEASVTMSYRIVYQIVGNSLMLRRIGTHDILRQATH
jgi:addiction module RelE/StbE family toxin